MRPPGRSPLACLRGLDSSNSWPTQAFRSLVWVIVALFAVLILGPVIVALLRAFTSGGSSAFADILAGGRAASVLRDTFTALLCAVAVAAFLGTMFAWANERTDARMGWLGDILPIAPLLVPPLAGTIGWILLAAPGPGFLNVAYRRGFTALGEGGGGFEGPINIYSWYGLIFLYVLYMVPLVYLTVGAGLRNLDPVYEEASRMAGAGPLRTLLRVTLPNIRPAIVGAALLALVFGLSMFSVPLLLATPAKIEILSVVIVRLMRNVFPAEISRAMAYSVIMIIIISVLGYLYSRVARSGRHAQIGGRSGPDSRVPLGRWKRPARMALVGYIAVTTVMPLFALIVVSLQRFWSPSIDFSALSLAAYRRALFEGFSTATAFRNSIVLGVSGATVLMVLAGLVSFASSRMRRSVSGTVQGVLRLPAAMSNVVIAVGFAAVFLAPPFSLHGTLLLLFLGYVVVNAPYASLTAEAAISQMGGELIEASAICGASDWRTFRRVAAPLMVPGLFAGWIFVFIIMAGDVTMSVMLASNRTPVVGFMMVDLFTNGSFPLAAAMGVIISVGSSVVVGGALLVSRYGLRQRARS